MPLLSRPRDLSYGWVMVVTLALTETTSWGILYYAFTVFVRPMQQSFGWSSAAITGAFSLALLISGVCGIPAGRWLDQRGPRLLMTAGSCLGALLVLAWAAVGNLTAFYLIWAGIGLVMAAVLYEPAFAVVAAWFSRERGRALTVLTFIAGFASVIYLPLAGWLVQAQGWRAALVTLAIVLAAGTIPAHALILRPHPHRRRSERALPPGRASVPLRVALRGPTFRWLTLAFSLNLFGSSAVLVHLVPYLSDRGLNPGVAAATAGLLGVAGLPGRLLFTPLGDRLPRGSVTACIFLLQAAALAALLAARGTAGVIAFVVLFGAGFGATTPARAALVADIYGPAQFASISGVMMLFVTGARGLGPVGAGVIRDFARGYSTLFLSLTFLSLAAAAAVLIAERSASMEPREDEHSATGYAD